MVSRQPRLPQRQTMPSGSTSTCPSSPASPAAAAVQAAVEDQAGADPGGDLQVDQVAGVAAGAERGLGQRAEVRVVVDHHRDVEPAAHLGGGGHPDPAGQDRGRADRAVALVDRAGQAHAGADHGLAGDARVGQRLDHELGGHLEAFLRVVVGIQRAGALGEDRAGEVGDRDAQVAVAEVDADGRAGARVEREQDRRAAALRAVRGAGLRALDHEPVGLQVGDEAGDGGAAESPVRRAISAREIWPSSRSARITRRRLRRRSDSSDPVRPGGMKSVTSDRTAAGSSTLERTDPPSGCYLRGYASAGTTNVFATLSCQRLLLRIPQHPEPAEVERDRADPHHQHPQERAAVADRAARRRCPRRGC